MKGVKINNYIDNRIVLSGRKLKNQLQTVIQSNRPRPLVIRNLNYIDGDDQFPNAVTPRDTRDHAKAIDSKSGTKRKRNKVVGAAGAGEKNQQPKEENRGKRQKSTQRATVSNKKYNRSSSASHDQEDRFNETQPRFKPVQNHNGGLGKRSKSAIIKRNRSPSHVVLPGNQTRRAHEEHNMKIDLSKRKQTETSKKKKKQKKDKKTTNEKSSIKKNVSALNISERNKGYEKQPSLRTGRQPSKSNISSTKNSKPVSARENHKKKSSLVGNISKNLFGKPEEVPEGGVISKLFNIKIQDVEVRQEMQKLQQAINTGSRLKIFQRLEVLASKLKKLEPENEPKSESADQQPFLSPNCKQQPQDQPQDGPFQHTHSDQQQEEAQAEPVDILNGAFTNVKIRGNFKNQTPAQEELKKDKLAQGMAQNDGVEIEVRFLGHQNGRYDNFEQDNPLIGRKAGGQNALDIMDYDSINSVKSGQESNERLQQISQLKKFQEQSDLMMKRIQKPNQKKQKEQQTQRNQQPSGKQTIKKASSPKNIEASDYAFEKYPTFSSLKSPKFNSQQIFEIVELKEKVLSNRNEKLSQLVNIMYQKKIVSPKTYNIQIHSLKQQQEQSSEVLDSYRKHAEQLSQLLQEIRKQKQQINNINQMIRSQNWDEAMKVIKTVQAPFASSTIMPIPVLMKEKNEDEQALQYEGNDSESEGHEFMKLSEIDNLQVSKPKQASHLIQIDEADYPQPKKQRGFESNLFFIKQYCIGLCEYVRDYHSAEFKQRIGQPLSYDLVQLLRDYRTSRGGERVENCNSMHENLRYHDSVFHHNVPAISEEIFNEFNKNYKNIKYYMKETTQDAELEGIFLKSIYNALNQSINIQKPGSLNGKALPWANTSKHLKNLKNSPAHHHSALIKDRESEDLIFGIAIARIIQWGSCLCGFIQDTVDLQNTQIDEEYIAHIRETRTALLLQKMLIDEEAEMERNQLEQTEVKINLGQLVFDSVVEELLSEMRRIDHKAALRAVDY